MHSREPRIQDYTVTSQYVSNKQAVAIGGWTGRIGGIRAPTPKFLDKFKQVCLEKHNDQGLRLVVLRPVLRPQCVVHHTHGGVFVSL